MKKAFLLIFVSLSFNIFCNYLEILGVALEKINNNDNLFIYESETISSDNKKSSITISMFDPRNNPKLQLISVDGNKPTEKDEKNFRRQSSDDSSKKMDDLLGNTYTFISEENGIAKYSYTTKSDLIPKIDSKMVGEIYLDIEKMSIKRLLLKNSSDISIAFGVSLNDFIMDFIFMDFNSEITIVNTLLFDIKGKAFVIDFNQKSKSTLYNYRLVANE